MGEQGDEGTRKWGDEGRGKWGDGETRGGEGRGRRAWTEPSMELTEPMTLELSEDMVIFKWIISGVCESRVCKKTRRVGNGGESLGKRAFLCVSGGGTRDVTR